MSQNSTMDLTKGAPMRQLLMFSLPLVAGTLFQQLYSFVDTMMVGRLLGEQPLAAVGSTHSLGFLVLGFVHGCCIGFGIPLAQAVGGKNHTEFRRFFWNGCWLCGALALVMTLLTVSMTHPLLQMIRTPADIFGDAAIYIRIAFWGIPAGIVYNFCAGALRASGDSHHPTLFLLISSFLNIALDYLLIAVIPMGVAGAALATVLSQLVSALLNLGWLFCKTDLLHNSEGLRGISGTHMRELCRVGLPMGFEYSVSAIGAVILQGSINALGTAAIAGQTAGDKIRQMFTLPMESVGMGMATYAGQNDGAKNYARIRQGIRAGLAIQWIYCAAAWAVIFVGKGAFTSLVLGSTADAAAAFSVQYLGIISCLFCFHGALMIFRNTLQGMGYSLHAVLSGVGELVGRAVCGLAAVRTGSFVGICLASPAAWALALAYCSVMTVLFLRKRTRQAAQTVGAAK